jgi:hypothetical protein
MWIVIYFNRYYGPFDSWAAAWNWMVGLPQRELAKVEPLHGVG